MVPDPASQIDDGAVIVHAGRVARVGRFADLSGEPARVVDLGEVALLPGLVNAHCHLDLTGARGRFAPTGDFPGWILGIRPLRDALRSGVAAAAEEGARELLAGGCTLVGDIVAEDTAVEGIRRSGIRAVAYFEVIGFADLVPRPLGGALEAAMGFPGDRDGLQAGLAPHTPYTCTDDLLRRCAAASREHGLPLTIHVGETRHEVDWLGHGEGPFSPLLRPLFRPGWAPPGRGPVDHLDSLGFLEEPRLLAHANYLEPSEIDRIVASGSVVAHCPGSHSFFGHDEHPVAALRRAGATVALGTDGLACHPDGVLSLTSEIRRLAAREPGIPPRDLLAMATTGGAEGLGLAGVLHPGSFADAAAFAVPGGWKGPESILDPDLRCTAAWVGGVSRLDPKGPVPRA